MSGSTLSFSAELWPWTVRRDEWWFVSVPAELAADIRDRPLPPRGFGSVRVLVTVGSTEWKTSIFPSDDGTYSLPIKKAVRTAEHIEPHDVIDVELDLLD